MGEPSDEAVRDALGAWHEALGEGDSEFEAMSSALTASLIIDELVQSFDVIFLLRAELDALKRAKAVGQ